MTTLVLALLLSGSPVRPVATYSIVARDPQTGQMGVAVQSHWFSVGSMVSWAEAGVGAVATQSFVDPVLRPPGARPHAGRQVGPRGPAGPPGDRRAAEVRQVGMIDAEGGLATHTGSLCIPEAGGQTGANYAVQANLMHQDHGLAGHGPGLRAGHRGPRRPHAGRPRRRRGGGGRHPGAPVGGPDRGGGRARPGSSWADRVFDLRVEDHPEPLVELRRLVGIQRAYNHMTAGDDCLALQDWPCAEREYGAARRLQPENAEMTFWYAVALATGGQLDNARPLFSQAFAADPRWRELVSRLPAVEQLPADPDLLQDILSIP